MIVQYTSPRWALVLMAVVLHGVMAALANAQTLTFPTAYDERSPHTFNIRVLANELKYATFGQLQLEVHPANAIYDAVRSGQEWLARTGKNGERTLTTYQERVTQHTH